MNILIPALVVIGSWAVCCFIADWFEHRTALLKERVGELLLENRDLKNQLNAVTRAERLYDRRQYQTEQNWRGQWAR